MTHTSNRQIERFALLGDNKTENYSPNKAFIFDLDGVVIDDEKTWDASKKQLYERLFGNNIANEINATPGLDIRSIFKIVQKYNTNVSLLQFQSELDKVAQNIYRNQPITKAIDDLISILVEKNFHIGLVSAAPRAWIDMAVSRLKNGNKFESILSIHDNSNLKPKPSPEGYLQTIAELSSAPEKTIILEDSNVGIASAKASGALTVALQQNILPGYKQTGADLYAKDIQEVISLLSNQ